MKLLRVGKKDQEIVAILDPSNKIRDISSQIQDLNPSTFNEEIDPQHTTLPGHIRGIWQTDKYHTGAAFLKTNS